MNLEIDAIRDGLGKAKAVSSCQKQARCFIEG